MNYWTTLVTTVAGVIIHVNNEDTGFYRICEIDIFKTSKRL